jgi:tetratricopeptide (TPR) repeat protein/nucleoside phosphorylase
MHAVKTSQPPVPPPNADVALLTIIQEAYEAVCQVFGLTWFATRGGYQWAWGFVQAQGHQVSVVVGLALDRENIAAATFTGILLDAWHPRHLLLVDIGGAVKERDDVQLGDVVTHTNLYYYDFKKETEDGDDLPRHLPHAPPSSQLRELSRRPGNRGDDTWVDRIHVQRPEEGLPKVLPGEMLVGGTLFANSPRLHRLIEKHPKVIAVEMEGVGVARSVLDWSVRGDVPEFLIIRGMSDFCNVPPTENQSTRDLWKRYAAEAAAAHAYALISEMTQPPAREGETSQRIPQHTEPLDNLWQLALTDLTGRDDEIDMLTHLFSGALPRDGAARPHVICGEAGMGKSVLARQVVERAGGQYQVRWWIDAADELKIRSGLRELARRLGIPSASTEVKSQGSQETEAHRYLNDLREYLDSNLLSGRVLVVLDNVDDPVLKHDLWTTVLRYLPPHACDVLITSQSSSWHPLAETTHLRGLKFDIGAKLIAVESGRPELALDPDVQEISTMFGGRPLFLKQVAALLRDGDEPAAFRAQLARMPEQALDALPEIEGFDPLWRATYTMAVDRAERSRPGARRMLAVLSCWAAEPMPHQLIFAAQPQDYNFASVDALLHSLVDRSLIEQQGMSTHRSYSVHRVVATLVRTLSKECGDLSYALSLAATATLNIIPSRERLRHLEGQRLMVGLAPHIWALMDHTLKFMLLGIPPETVKTVAECASMMGLHLWTMSEWVALEKAYDISVQLSEHIHDPGGAALRKIRLANVLRQRGQFQRAEGLAREAMPDLERFGDPCDYAWGITAEARMWRHRPNSAPQEALARLYDALAILESSERRHEPVILRQLSELHGYISVLNRQLSNLSEAEKESEKGLRLILKDMNPEDVLKAAVLPDDYLVATHVRALGGVWRLRGDFRRANMAHERALKIFERIYGRDHTDIYRALDSLGRVQREWGNLEGALQTFERAGQIAEKLVGANHAHVGTAAVNRALVYLELGQHDKAYEEAARGLNIYRVAYKEPEDNSKLRNEATVWALFVQADTLAAIGELDRAVRDHECVLNWRLDRQQSGHAHQASSYFALAEAIWRRDGDAALEQVLDYHRRALTIREQVFGSAPNFWIAQSQARLGYLTRDVGLLQRAYECFSQQLKPSHWRTRAVAAAIEMLNRQQPQH